MSENVSQKVSFGEELVSPEEKTRRVGEVFSSVARRYDVMNDLMSGGLHRLWKDRFVARVKPRAGERILDMAGGTGDIALRVLKDAGVGTRAVICDISAEMIETGRARGEGEGESGRLAFVRGNAEGLPFADKSFDAYTIAFGVRNLTLIDAALAEAFRVLKPGGRFLCLEFSHVDVPLLDRLYEVYSFGAIPILGGLVTGNSAAYQYLVESIRRFPDQKAFAGMIEAVGFERVQYRNLTGGIAAIHSAWRL